MNTISFPGLGLKFNIDPIALHYNFLGGGAHWYGIIIAFGIILAVLYCSFVAKRENEPPDSVTDMVIYALPVSVIFARTYYVVFSWESYRDRITDVFKIWEGGLAIYGGIIGAVITSGVFWRMKKINVLKMYDICCLGLLIGQSVGRWGNFVNCEAHGDVCRLPWRMSINNGPAVHPTFLYESLWNFVGFLILSKLNRKRPFYGFTFYGYLIWYGIGRFIIEGMRTDSLYFGAVRISQIVAVICVVTGVICMISGFVRRKRNI